MYKFWINVVQIDTFLMSAYEYDVGNIDYTK